jgi:hypothetical protein
MEIVVRNMSRAFEVGYVCLDILFGLTPLSPWF